tara:strand:- start:172 stop:1290 length:1119 start_codon:yes stop_codon:yes gene_type:complete
MKNYLNLGVNKSKGRLYKEFNSSLRSPFQRDRDRIIHSESFRRLKHKTQVFVNTEGDHYRTRLTHSMEVAQIARTIARYFNLNEDLTETLSLAHDLGHTPFGHAGEDVLNECMDNHGGFDHNLQTLRIIMFIENKYLNFSGLNLTIETLDGLLKHNGPIKNKSNLDLIIGIKKFNNKIEFKNGPSLEAQISSISDDIAYNNHDIQDGVRAKLFSINELIDINFLKDIYKTYTNLEKKNNKEIIIYQLVRDSINLMVKDLLTNTIKNIKKNEIKKTNDVYRLDNPIVSFSKKIQEVDKEIKIFLRKKMYNNKYVLKKNNKGKEIIKKLFTHIYKNPNKFINNNLVKYDKFRAVADFISGMTDRYAINIYNNIK